MDSSTTETREIWQVSDLNRSLKSSLQQLYGRLWVEGEISNLARPASGHLYFTIKDAHAQIRCVLFRSALSRGTFQPEHGDQVLVQASASVYEARGDLQLICESIEPAGDGKLQRQFEEIKQKLFKEGLFDDRNKKPLPAFPSIIAVVSSGSGAAFQDFRKVIQRRFPLAELRLYDVLVQGKQAVPQIQSAIEHIRLHAEAEVIALIRGGGSLEDLWAFNDEALARQLADCPLPIITGIGHEIDFTIADFVADVRAPTPSAAAELLSPDQAIIRQTIRSTFNQIQRAVQDQLRSRIQAVDWQQQRLQRSHPATRLQQYRQVVSEQFMRLQQLALQQRDRRQQRSDSLQVRLRNLSPLRLLNQHRTCLGTLTGRMIIATEHRLEESTVRLQLAKTTLHAVSPLQTVKRGYAIALSAESGKVIRSHHQIKPGQRLKIALQEGHLEARVDSTSPRSLFDRDSKSQPGGS